MGRGAVLTGLGSAVPEEIVTNEMLTTRLDTSDEWIFSRTGIKERRVVKPGMATSDLAVEAGRRALSSAGVDTVDAVVLATTTPDYLCPATAPAVARMLNLPRVAAFDVSAVCAGFLYGLVTGAGLLATDVANRTLVIGADAFTTIVDPADRNTAPLFGDGAGAVVLEAGRASRRGALLAADLGSDGQLADLIRIPAGGSSHRSFGELPAPTDHFLTMNGKAVFVNAVLRMAESARTVLARTGWAIEDVDWLIGHQANVRILHAVAEQLGLPIDRAFVNITRYGNTAAASIPLALDEATTTGVLKPGHRVLLTAFGGGVSWGAVTIEWPDLSPS